ncbi:MAG: sigma-70 family RNA polymerase sigma factor [Cytophagales bacterium]|nr:sigma-70 family RNA polymerase sigma factor [Cytophagales bacterium]
MQTEKEWVDQLTNPATKREAFRQLVKTYERPLYSVIRKMVIDHELARDLMQDTFIKVWENMDRFKAESKLYTWMYRIAVNECLQHLAKTKRRSIVRVDYSDELAQKLEAQESLSGDELQLKLQKALLCLPDKQRLVFNLKYYEDMDYEQMAEITETSAGALRASYHHAVKKIEKYLQANA